MYCIYGVGYCVVYSCLGPSTTFIGINESRLHTFFYPITPHTEQSKTTEMEKINQIISQNKETNQQQKEELWICLAALHASKTSLDKLKGTDKKYEEVIVMVKEAFIETASLAAGPGVGEEQLEEILRSYDMI